MPALALTNHGNTFGLIDHFKACTEAGIKPVLGMEAYITVGEAKPASRKLCHQTLLVENEAGYRNLMKLVTKSQELFYYRPRLTMKMLAEHQEGLMILSGCPSSLVARRILSGKTKDAEVIFAWMARELEGRFWCEIQPSEIFKDLAPLLVKWAKKYKVPMVATSDAHYVEKADRVVHDAMLKLKMAKGEEEATMGAGYHILTRDEFAEALRGRHAGLTALQVDGMLDETVRITERVNFTFEKPKRLLPPRWKNPQKLLRELGEAGLKKYGFAQKKAYVDRLNRELSVIDQLGFHEYFLVCWHIIDHAHKEGILIGPRGSVCGSLLAYVLGITMVDPLVHGTLFERFLHEERKTLPDIDIDVDSRKREKLVAWIKEEYGPNVVPIITFGRYASQSMANDLEKLFPEEMDEETKTSLIIVGEQMRKDRVYAPVKEDMDNYFTMEFPELRRLRKRVKDFDRIFLKMFNQVRYIGRHPGGLCFTPGTYTNWFGSVKPKAAADYLVTCYAMTDIEFLGLIKFDFLGLGAMGAIQECIDLVRERHGDKIVLSEIPLDEPQLYEQFSAGNTDGIFQFETGGARQMLREIEPEAFHELAAVNALNRPGVMDNLEAYIAGKRRAASGEKAEGYFSTTYGAVVYQEDIMLMLRNLGFTWGETDKFLKWAKSATAGAVGARKAEAMVLVEKFVKALVKDGWKKNDADEYVHTLTKYSFNRAHATGYTLVAYWTMWLRRNYALEYWTGLLDVEPIEEKRVLYEKAAIMDGCVLLPPHINSTRGYSIEDNAIRVGLKTIKAVGDVASTAIVDAQPYDSAADFLNRLRLSMRDSLNGKKRLERRQINVKILRALLDNGALFFDEERWARHAEDYNVRRKQARVGNFFFRKAEQNA